jgi:hypothetical protein
MGISVTERSEDNDAERASGGLRWAGVFIGRPAVSAAATDTKRAYEMSLRSANRGGLIGTGGDVSKPIGATHYSTGCRPPESSHHDVGISDDDRSATESR